MPHCEIKYSDNLDFDAEAILSLVETVVNTHDANSHECKGRAYPSAQYHRSHLHITVSLLSKPHRDEVFTQALMNDLEEQIKARLQQSCYFSLMIEYSPAYYVTNEHLVTGDDLPRYRTG